MKFFRWFNRPRLNQIIWHFTQRIAETGLKPVSLRLIVRFTIYGSICKIEPARDISEVAQKRFLHMQYVGAIHELPLHSSVICEICGFKCFLLVSPPLLMPQYQTIPAIIHPESFLPYEPNRVHPPTKVLSLSLRLLS